MKKYKQVKVECLKYTELLEVYEWKYKQEYQLIGYSHDSLKESGVLVLYPRKGESK